MVSGVLGARRRPGTLRRVGRPGGAADCRRSHRARDRSRSSSTAICRTTGGARHAHRQVVRDQPGRQHRAEGPQRRPPRLRRQFFYAAFEFDDPDPRRDPRAVRRSRQHAAATPPTTAGVILDTRNDGHTAVLLLANAARHPVRRDHRRCVAARTPRRTSSGTPRRRSPSTAGRSRSASRSRRCATANADPQTWGILLYRNYPRDFRLPDVLGAAAARRQLLHLPREHARRASSGLPAGGHSSSRRTSSAGRRRGPRRPRVAARGRRRASRERLDVKWTPNADNVVDVTVKPDFSQIESDTAQISTNERFALFFPEKRPFFLEGVDLLATPIQAVYTRTITAPRWGGARHRQVAAASATRRSSPTTPAAAAVILPGPNGSSLADSGFRLDGRHRAGQARHRPLVRQRARDRPRGRRRRRPQPGRRSGLPVAPVRQRRRHRAVALQRHANAEPARCLAGVDGPVADLARRAT